MTLQETVDHIGDWRDNAARNHAIAVMRAAIQAAILSERQSCAQLARAIGSSQGAFLAHQPTADAIADAILSPKDYPF